MTDTRAAFEAWLDDLSIGADEAPAAWGMVWDAAVEAERAEACKLADALMALLGDTQHAKHPSCTDGGYCPVRDAREALEAYRRTAP